LALGKRSLHVVPPAEAGSGLGLDSVDGGLKAGSTQPAPSRFGTQENHHAG